MASENLTTSLDYFWSQQNPFVFFRTPGEKTVHCYYQKEITLHQTNSLEIEGFILAPFLPGSTTYYIPAQHRLSFEAYKLPKPTLTTSRPQLVSSKESFLKLVQTAKAMITDNRLRKVVVSRQTHYNQKTNPIALFLSLLEKYPNAMVSFWHHPELGTWLGATPEQLISKQGAILKTMALAGTRVFTQNKPAAWTSKEVEEQQLVTDQLKSDLESRFESNAIHISKPYSKRAGNLVHLCTDFKLETSKADLKSLLEMIHPTPAVGGVPRKEALAFLKSNENYNRSFYAGYLGPINASGIELFVNLRCAEWSSDVLKLFVGAGITAHSVPEKEWEETERKAETLLNAL